MRENEEVVCLPFQFDAGPHSEAAVLSRERTRALALEAGFAEAGLIVLPHTHQERDAARFEEWVAAGRAGTMGWLERRDRSARNADSVGEVAGSAVGSIRSSSPVPVRMVVRPTDRAQIRRAALRLFQSGRFVNPATVREYRPGVPSDQPET